MCGLTTSTISPTHLLLTCACSQGGEAKDEGEAKDVGDAATPLTPAFSAGPAGQLEALSLADFSGWTALHWACSRGLPEVRWACWWDF